MMTSKELVDKITDICNNVARAHDLVVSIAPAMRRVVVEFNDRTNKVSVSFSKAVLFQSRDVEGLIADRVYKAIEKIVPISQQSKDLVADEPIYVDVVEKRNERDITIL